MFIKFSDRIAPNVNYSITAREDGRVVHKHEAHNIFLDNGRQFISEVICATLPFPPGSVAGVPERDNSYFVRYMGFGVGGDRQTHLSIVNSPPVSDWYPGGNTYPDTDPTVTGLERPIAVSYVGSTPERYLNEVTFISRPDATSVTFVANFGSLDLNGDNNQLPVAPISEIALYLSSADPLQANGGGINHAIAYDTFDSIPITPRLEIQVEWTLRF